MDKVLRDIRNFFKKLESGQSEIEAGQWELHKDVCKIKRLFEELKRLKDNVDEMRITNVRQMSIIKSLEKKLECFKNKFKEKEDEEECENNSYECEDEARDSDSGCSTKKPRIIHSEEIIEITSCTNTNPASKANCDQQETNEKNSECRSPSRECSPDRNRCNIRKTCNEMLQRYLNDSAKYSKKRLEKSSKKGYCCDEPQENDCYKDAEAWDNYSCRLPQGPICKNSDRSYTQSESSDSCGSIEPVMPTSISCSRCPKNCMIKADFLRHGKYKKYQNQRSDFYEPFRKDLETLELFRAPKEARKEALRNPKFRRCGYCSKICYSPEMLSSHVNKCRLLMKSRFNRY